MATGTQAFRGSTSALIFDAIMHKAPTPLSRLRPDLPVQLQHIIWKALEKDRETRYQTASDLLADLKRLKRDTDSGREAATLIYSPASGSGNASSGSILLGEMKKHKLAFGLGLTLVLIAIAGGLIVAYRLARQGRSAGLNLQNMTITKLTDSGNVAHAAISPDGRYLAYVTREARPSLWVRQVAAESAVPLLPPAKTSLDWVAFSPDGDYIYFQREFQIFVMPALGGTARPLLGGMMPFGAAISSDGKKLAFIRHPGPNGSTLNIANTDSTGERVIAEGHGPEYFGIVAAPSWSPDGKVVAASSWWNKGQYDTAIRCFPVDGGKPILLLPSTGYVIDSVWLRDQSGLLVALEPKSIGHSQIWLQPFPRGTLQRVTNDLNDYSDLSLTRDGKLLAAVEGEEFSTVFVAPSSDPDQGVPITAARRDGLTVAWMPNGMLLLQDSKSEFSLAQADGSNRVPLFQDDGYRPGVSGLSVCGDGRFIVFASDREANRSNIWRLDANGRNLKRLTEGELDLRPHCSADGTSVVYDSSVKKNSDLMKVSIEGGSPSVLAEGYLGSRYSPDGKQIASYTGGKIAILSSAGGPILKSFDLAPHGTLNYWDYSMLHWTPDGKALTYPLLEGNAMNLWKQPVAGGPPQQITHFTDPISAYDWSPDGKRLAISHGKWSSDVV